MKERNPTTRNLSEPSCAIVVSLQQTQIDLLFNNLIHRPWGYACWQPLIDVVETDAAYICIFDLPGVDPDGVSVRLERGRLTVDGCRTGGGLPEDAARLCCAERPTGMFHRTIDLNEPTTGEVTRRYESGVLTIVLQKKNAGELK
ncbi:MAG: Hsp20/alpha crystallin family protein [Planctomycetaceae bacterium]|nr:Hsp20/alpha crystallin family protein [Planctomycetaceae bacterium]